MSCQVQTVLANHCMYDVSEKITHCGSHSHSFGGAPGGPAVSDKDDSTVLGEFQFANVHFHHCSW